jgi:hypothetical protein
LFAPIAVITFPVAYLRAEVKLYLAGAAALS